MRMSRGLSSLPGCKKKEGNVMLQGRKGKGMCAVLLMLVMCFGPVPAEAQAEIMMTTITIIRTRKRT